MMPAPELENPSLCSAIVRLASSQDLPTVKGIVATAMNVVTPWGTNIEREVRTIARQYVHLIMKHRRACAEGTYARIKASRNLLLSSRSARICAVLKSAKGGRSLGKYVEQADNVRARHPSNERVNVVPRPKGDGTSRAINIFGLIETAKQTLVRDILIARFGYSPYEFSRRGRGREAVIRNTLHALSEEGTTHLVEADIRNCFPSAKASSLGRYLNLPRSVVQNTVQISASSPIHIHKDLHLSNRMVRAGLPLGSRLSPYLMSKIIEPVLDQIDAPNRRSFVDNIGFCARSSSEADAEKLSLAVLLDQHPAGPFKLRYSTTLPLGEENDVLGYLIRPQHRVNGAVARATPSKPAILRAQRKLAASLAYSSEKSWSQAVEDWSVSWASRYPSWKGRADGATSAFLAAYDRVIPHVREFHREALSRPFHSFAEMSHLAQAVAAYLLADPFYTPLKKWDGGPLAIRQISRKPT